jgi:hypothetical protein
LIIAFKVSASQKLEIILANGSEAETLKKQQLERIISKYDLSKWLFTETIKVDENTRSPFSHPILTVGAKRPHADLSALSQLIHEQIHWYEDPRKSQVENVVAELQGIYPEVPIGYPNGARNEFSTYLHLAVCLLELDALSHLLGEEKAREIISNNSKYFYKWIYQKVLSDTDKIRIILVKNDLYL